MNRHLQGDEAGLVGYWNFNEGKGNIANDSTKNNNNGTVFGATWTTGVETIETTQEVTELYQNNDGSFDKITTSFTNLSDPSLAWGDYDNDGKLDLLITGTDTNNQPVTEIYTKDADGNFTLLEDNQFLMTSIQNGEATWGDYDNDGDLDIILSGAAGSNAVSFSNELIGIVDNVTGLDLSSSEFSYS